MKQLQNTFKKEIIESKTGGNTPSHKKKLNINKMMAPNSPADDVSLQDAFDDPEDNDEDNYGDTPSIPVANIIVGGNGSSGGIFAGVQK